MDQTHTDEVLYDVTGGVATITLNRPEALNAFTTPMRLRFSELVAAADADSDVAVIVITGAGRGFCAGADTNDLQSIDGGVIRDNDAITAATSLGHLRNVTKPLFAAVNGACAGMGFCLALMADVRFVAAEAKITTSFSRLGLPAETGSSWLLPRLVGTARALDLLYSARVLSGQEAYDIGWAQWVYPADALAGEVAAYAAAVASRSPHSLAVMRDQVLTDGASTFERSFDTSVELTALAVDRPEFQALLAGRPRGG
ncbi:enoyl-CoA hydratase/isomerase family protein [Acidiferrimicrobium sp. IK]|uniref:enoyl-CoA hydratase-related protein n=1 Tax=Acidiferrimicrobium sp. IK TaxID=2871700 RepID=UPI0021CAE655|nr:enoyl-CoA hydratase-related protein [Acidiferrimicrobium sp. IK]MCU4185061.1 enoyl-CoA hydratase/isomerase family protein [Acidiferrimicrobium sp. IK]